MSRLLPSAPQNASICSTDTWYSPWWSLDPGKDVASGMYAVMAPLLHALLWQEENLPLGTFFGKQILASSQAMFTEYRTDGPVSKPRLSSLIKHKSKLKCLCLFSCVFY